MRIRTSWLISAATLALSCIPVAAQSPRVSGMRIDWNVWNFKPIYDDSSGMIRVSGFLAMAKEGTVAGDNIVAVWYLRNNDGTWSKKSWLTSDATEAIKSVKISMGIPDSEDNNWEAGQDLRVLPTDDPELPKDYSKGLLADDPLYPILATCNDAATLVSMLAQIGYKAADIHLDNTSGCSADSILDSMAVAIEAGMAITVIDDASSQVQTKAMATVLSAVTVCAQAAPATCTPGLTGLWALGAISPPRACSWSVTDSWTTATGGRAYTCNYTYCCTYTRSRSAPAIRSDCSTYTCTQIEIQRACSPAIVCGPINVPTPTAPAVWAAPCGTTPTCSTLPPVIPAAPVIWTWPNNINCP